MPLNQREKKLSTRACTALLKTLILAFNLIFFSIGLAFFVIGIYGIKVFHSFFTFAPSTSIYAPFICTGIFMMLVGILALWCTPKGVTWLLYLYGTIVFFLFILVISMSSLFVVRRDKIESNLKEGIQNAMDSYPNSSDSIDILQETIKCCGNQNYTDWFETSWGKNSFSVPKSCCKIAEKNACVNTNLDQLINVHDIYTEGCYSKVEKAIESNYALISGIGFASAFTILFGTFLSCCLARTISKNNYEQME